MPSNHTEHYDLSQWEPEDAVLRTDFNEDNAKIDAALGSLKDELAAQESTLKSHAGTMSKLGNCQIQHTSYTGSGATTRTFSLPSNTLLVIITSGARGCLTAVRGTTKYVTVCGNGVGGNIAAEWGANSLTLTFETGSTSSSNSVCNESGVAYNMITLRTL